MAMKAPTLFSFRPANSLLHRVPAGIKLIALLLATIMIFSANLRWLTVASICLLLLIPAGHIRLKVIARNLLIIFWYGIFIAAFRVSGKPAETAIILRELQAAGLYTWQLAIILLTGTFFYETTSTLDIRYTITRLQKGILRILQPFIRKCPFLRQHEFPDIALLLSLTLAFIPRIFIIWNDLNHAWDARGGCDRKGLSPKLRRITVLMPLVIAKLLIAATDTERAIRNRSI